MNEINNITQKVVNDLLKDGSKYVIIPPGRKPLIVTIDTTILGLPYISELHMEFTVSFYFRMNWIDPRLKFDPGSYGFDNITHVILLPDKMEKIWRPEIFFRNERGASLSAPLSLSNSVSKIHSNGSAFLSRKLETTLRCEMKFQAFPFDEQNCSLDISSYAYDTDTLMINWKSPAPIQIDDAMYLPAGFSLKTLESSTFIETVVTGNYPGARLTFTLRRDSGFYNLQVSYLFKGSFFMTPFIQQNIIKEQSATKSEHTLNENKHLENKRSTYFMFQLYLPSAIVVIL